MTVTVMLSHDYIFNCKPMKMINVRVKEFHIHMKVVRIAVQSWVFFFEEDDEGGSDAVGGGGGPLLSNSST